MFTACVGDGSYKSRVAHFAFRFSVLVRDDFGHFRPLRRGVPGGCAPWRLNLIQFEFPLQLTSPDGIFHRADMRQRANFPGAAQDSNLFRLAI